MSIPIKEIAANRKLRTLLANHLAVRMNRDKRYSADEIVSALGDLGD